MPRSFPFVERGFDSPPEVNLTFFPASFFKLSTPDLENKIFSEDLAPRCHHFFFLTRQVACAHMKTPTLRQRTQGKLWMFFPLRIPLRLFPLPCAESSQPRA